MFKTIGPKSMVSVFTRVQVTLRARSQRERMVVWPHGVSRSDREQRLLHNSRPNPVTPGEEILCITKNSLSSLTIAWIYSEGGHYPSTIYWTCYFRLAEFWIPFLILYILGSSIFHVNFMIIVFFIVIRLFCHAET